MTKWFIKEKKSILFVFTCIALTIIYFWGFLSDINTTSIVDSDFYLAWQLVETDHLKNGELLHWNQYICGGTPGISNPQSRALSPFLLLGLIFPPILHFKIDFIINVIIGALSFIFFSKRFKLKLSSCIGGFIFWLCNGYVSFRIFHGQANYFPLMIMPWFLFMLLDVYRCKLMNENIEYKKYSIWGTVLLVLILLQDGFHITMYCFTLFAILAIYFWRKTKDLVFVKLMFIWCITSLTLIIPRLLPIYSMKSIIPKEFDHKETLSILEYLNNLFNLNQKGIYTSIDSGSVWKAGFTSYMGLIPFILIPFSLKYERFKKYLLFTLIVCVPFIVFSFGHFSEYSPWSLIHKFPLITMIRAPFKLISIVMLIFIPIVIFGIEKLSIVFTDKFKLKANHHYFAMTISLLLFANYYYVHSPVSKIAFNYFNKAGRKIDHSKPFSQKNVSKTTMYDSISDNIGVLNCYDAVIPPKGVNTEKPFAYLESGKGKVKGSIGSNQITLKTELKTNSTIRINHNFHEFWEVEKGKAENLRMDKGSFLIDIPKGNNLTTLRFIPASFNFGFFILKMILLCCVLSILAIKFLRKKSN